MKIRKSLELETLKSISVRHSKFVFIFQKLRFEKRVITAAVRKELIQEKKNL